ncbi:MAG: cupin domain-containing protein [Pseudomonadota bacterium]|uniref:Quercetin dioxygenase-like cupin family protein n=2 Tax=Gallaecimonas pentaromativorans TaxID=584787 RepID=A0A3N1PDA0_9GAMM|nr:cupin domain-containing protein [Gallaecimonas pentaromativorans]MED5526469.1 cupin domain-containing protein [Pseudomonadota bacterium]ROQ25798.1 quercetin dioxygenase-like cupin family protein [Gallaecimonas pentaromativorans]
MSNTDSKDLDMQVHRAGASPAIKGPTDWFTGNVRIDRIFNAPGPSRIGLAVVNFEPGARTNWHSHPLGQTLLVTDGVGWTQCEGGPKTEIRPGDLIWCNCGRRHWHGATDTTAMQHVAVQEALDGSPVTWFEPVSDADYLAGPVKKD